MIQRVEENKLGSYSEARKELEGFLNKEQLPANVHLDRMVQERVFSLVYKSYTFFVVDPLDGFFVLLDEKEINPEWYKAPNLFEVRV